MEGTKETVVVALIASVCSVACFLMHVTVSRRLCRMDRHVARPLLRMPVVAVLVSSLQAAILTSRRSSQVQDALLIYVVSPTCRSFYSNFHRAEDDPEVYFRRIETQQVDQLLLFSLARRLPKCRNCSGHRFPLCGRSSSKMCLRRSACMCVRRTAPSLRRRGRARTVAAVRPHACV